jgi:hypothetical protein
MKLCDRFASLERLGEKLRRFNENSRDAELLPLCEAATLASRRNAWFTPEILCTAINNLGAVLNAESLKHWMAPYEKRLENMEICRTVGVVMAGNIPAVGFHDFLCVLVSGHKLLAKLSASDDLILPAIASLLISHLPEWSEFISFSSGKLERFDAIIATGSTNTSRYFDFYFGSVPNIIRRSRNSIAILNGQETEEDLVGLADDIMLYFGMGCRNISKVYVPAGYDFTRLIKALEKYKHYAHHHKYRNNYDYNRSIYMVSQLPFIDTGFLLLTEEKPIASRIAMLNYEFYADLDAVIQKAGEAAELLQCVVSNIKLPLGTIQPGEAQRPALSEYADHVDTLEFLISLA